MEGRTIPLHGGGELTVGGEPRIDGLVGCWSRPRSTKPGNFMVDRQGVRQLADAMSQERRAEIPAFAGKLNLHWKRWSSGEEEYVLLTIWFTAWGQIHPDFVVRLADGAIDTATEVFEEAAADLGVAA